MTDVAATRPGEHSGEPAAGSGPGSSGWKLRALGALLDRAGVVYYAVRAAGGEGEIAVVDAPRTELMALSGLARDVRRLGYRFLALDLAGRPSGGTGDDKTGFPLQP